MVILPYESRHHDAVAALWFASARSISLPFVGDLTYAELHSRIPEEIASGWAVHLGWRGDTLVGFLALLPDVSRLDQLFILPQAQRSGCGAELLDFAKRSMPEGMWLGTAFDSVGSRRFYEKHGFRVREIGVHPRLGYPTITYHWP